MSSNSGITVSTDARLIPKYGQVARDLRRRIEDGEWIVGEAIPPVPELQRRYGFTRMTILKALNRLSRDGYLSVEQGRGTFVKRQRVCSLVGLFFGDDIFKPASLPFSALMARAAQDFFHERHNELKFYIEHAHLRGENVLDRDLIADIEEGRLRGLLTVGSNAPRALAANAFWRRHAVPWVDVSVFDAAAHRVVFDRETAYRIAFDYVGRLGRRRVAALGLSRDDLTDSVTPFLEAVRARGLTTRDAWVPKITKPTEQAGYDGMRHIWDSAEKPDALILFDDVVAKGASQAMLALGIRTPVDLAVISHANRGSEFFFPLAFPKFELDPVEVMRHAGTMLLRLIENPLLPPEMIAVRPRFRTK